MRRQAVVEEDPPLLTAEHLRAAAGISHVLGVLSTELSQQSDAVQGIASAADESLDNMRKGNKELVEAVSRPSSLRHVATSLMLILCVLLVFLDWYY